MQPQIHIAYLPQKNGSLSALMYLAAEFDIYGWYARCKKQRCATAFFMVENFYAIHQTVLHRSVLGDVYGPWSDDFPAIPGHIRCPLPELIGHELERMQFEFISEWLFFKNDPAGLPEARAYAALGLQLNAINIKANRLKRLSEQDHALRYATSGADLNVMEFLHKHLRPNSALAFH